MLKWTRRMLVFLLLGAIVNVAVAWGCVLVAGDRPGDPSIRYRFDCPIPEVTLTERFGVHRVNSSGKDPWPEYLPQFGQDGRPVEYPKYPSDLRSHEWVSEGPSTLTLAGWPLLSFEGWELHPHFLSEPAWLHDRRESLRWAWTWESGIRVPDGPPMLPLRPRPLQFLANSALYGTLVLLLLACCASLRRAIRKGQGRCVHCAYPRGTSPVCTECGAPLPC